LPPLAALLGLAISRTPARAAKMVALIAASAAMLWFIPAIQDLLPEALLHGFSHAQFHSPLAWILPALALTLACGFLERAAHRGSAIALISTVIVLSVARFVTVTYPQLDQTVSPRSFWISHAGSITCSSNDNRSWRYGLNYYAGHDVPDCN
jgi:hypothetical protein